MPQEWETGMAINIHKNQMPEEWETGIAINIHKKRKQKTKVKTAEELLYCLRPTK